jgi:polyphosphate kinase 2 (PPK2 family)
MKMKINSKDFRVRPGGKVKLGKWPTRVKPFCKSKKQYQKLLEKHVEDLSSLQRLHYASNHYALLLIFQGMDAAGKDGAIGHVMSGVNPQGCEVFSFEQLSAEELKHDFLWRTTCRLPERGRIGIFTKAEQRKRFLERIDEPDKNWKFSLADIHERIYWPHYMKAYEDCLNATSTHHVPWYVVPADDKDNARLVVSRIVLDALEALKMTYPKTTAKRRLELKSIRKRL